MAIVRTKKGGGCSLCNASDENVGKRKCCHILDNASIEVKRENGVNFIDVSGTDGNEETTFSIKASETKIRNYIKSLSEGLTKEEKEEILAILRNE